jgi:hypothetical protein
MYYFYKIIQKQICDAYMPSCHAVVLPATTSRISPSIMQVLLQLGLAKFVIALQDLYKKILHSSICCVSYEDSHARTKVKCVVLTLYWVSTTVSITQLADPILPTWQTTGSLLYITSTFIHI